MFKAGVTPDTYLGGLEALDFLKFPFEVLNEAIFTVLCPGTTLEIFLELCIVQIVIPPFRVNVRLSYVRISKLERAC